MRRRRMEFRGLLQCQFLCHFFKAPWRWRGISKMIHVSRINHFFGEEFHRHFILLSGVAFFYFQHHGLSMVTEQRCRMFSIVSSSISFPRCHLADGKITLPKSQSINISLDIPFVILQNLFSWRNSLLLIFFAFIHGREFYSTASLSRSFEHFTRPPSLAAGELTANIPQLCTVVETLSG